MAIFRIKLYNNNNYTLSKKNLAHFPLKANEGEFPSATPEGKKLASNETFTKNNSELTIVITVYFLYVPCPCHLGYNF